MFLCSPVCSAVSGFLTDSCALQVSILLLLLLLFPYFVLCIIRNYMNLVLIFTEPTLCKSTDCIFHNYITSILYNYGIYSQ